MKNLMAVVVVGWFFWFQHAFQDNEVTMVRYLVGPFASEAECKAELRGAVAVFGVAPRFKAEPCKERVEA